jgi:hypothetical protein
MVRLFASMITASAAQRHAYTGLYCLQHSELSMLCAAWYVAGCRAIASKLCAVPVADVHVSSVSLIAAAATWQAAFICTLDHFFCGYLARLTIACAMLTLQRCACFEWMVTGQGDLHRQHSHVSGPMLKVIIGPQHIHLLDAQQPSLSKDFLI